MHGKQRVKGSPVSSLISLVAETSYCLHLSRLEICALVWTLEQGIGRRTYGKEESKNSTNIDEGKTNT